MQAVHFPRRLAACAAPLALIFMSPAVFAHAHLESQIPAANAALALAPKTIELKFSEDVEPRFTGIAVSGPARAPIKLGAPSVKPQDKSWLVVPVQGPMPAGSYRVRWHAVSVDGHKTKGEYGFSIK